MIFVSAQIEGGNSDKQEKLKIWKDALGEGWTRTVEKGFVEKEICIDCLNDLKKRGKIMVDSTLINLFFFFAFCIIVSAIAKITGPHCSCGFYHYYHNTPLCPIHGENRRKNDE